MSVQVDKEKDSIFKQKRFSELGKLAYLKGQTAADIVKSFTDEVKNYPKNTMHNIRQQMFDLQDMDRLKSMTIELELYIDRMPYTIENEFQCVYLRTCRLYHKTHINKIAEDIQTHGLVTCHKCQAKCQNASDIIIDALVHSYFFKVKNFENSILIFKSRDIGSQAYKETMQNEINYSQDKTMVNDRREEGSLRIIEIKVLQVDVKDERTNGLGHTELADSIDLAIKRQQECQFQIKELNSISYPLVCNLICYSTFARIRNPLIHKMCSPSQHKNRLILYSYEHVYSVINKKQKDSTSKKVKCMYPQCRNYFDGQNFNEMAIIINNFKIPIYEQKKQNLFGSYYSNFYHKNWHHDLSKNMLQNSEFDRHMVKRYLPEIKQLITSLITNANLEDAKKCAKKAVKRCKQDKDGRLKLAQFQGEHKIMSVNLSDFNLCPVRCIKCSNLNTLDAYKLSYIYLKSEDKKCPICKSEFIKSRFYDNFYIDTELMRFIFFEGHAREIYFDAQKKDYFHKVSYYTGANLKDKLKQERKVTCENLYKYEMKVKLDNKTRYIPFIDSRCKQSIAASRPEQINKHYIYLADCEKISETVMCQVCNRKLRVDKLQINEELEYILKNNKNQLNWTGSSENQFYAKNMSIISVKYYREVYKEYIIKADECKFYWKNYQGTLIKYPFRFKKCTHPFETTVCDFGDILYQQKFEGITKFKCRYKECDQIYQSAEDMQRLDIDIYKILNEMQQQMRDAVESNKYWITFDFEKSIIKAVSNKYDDRWTEEQELKEIDKYRNKFLNNEEMKDKKTIMLELSKLQKLIKEEKVKVEEDEIQFKNNSGYKHSKDEQELRSIKNNLRLFQKKRSDLQEIKRQLNTTELQENRRKNNTSSINFNLLSKQYESQLKGLNIKKKSEEVNYSKVVSFQNFQLFGNLYPFPYQQPIFRNINRPIQNATQLKEYLEKINKAEEADKPVYTNFNAEIVKKK